MEITLENGITVDIYDEHPIVAQLNALVASETIDIRIPLDTIENYIGRTIVVPSYTPANEATGILKSVHFDRHDNYYSIFFEDGTVAGIEGNTDNDPDGFVIVLAH